MMDIYAFYERADGALCVKERLDGNSKPMEWGTTALVEDRHRDSPDLVVRALGMFVAAGTLGAEHGLHTSSVAILVANNWDVRVRVEKVRVEKDDAADCPRVSINPNHTVLRVSTVGKGRFRCPVIQMEAEDQSDPWRRMPADVEFKEERPVFPILPTEPAVELWRTTLTVNKVGREAQAMLYHSCSGFFPSLLVPVRDGLWAARRRLQWANRAHIAHYVKGVLRTYYSCVVANPKPEQPGDEPKVEWTSLLALDSDEDVDLFKTEAVALPPELELVRDEHLLELLWTKGSGHRVPAWVTWTLGSMREAPVVEAVAGSVVYHTKQEVCEELKQLKDGDGNEIEAKKARNIAGGGLETLQRHYWILDDWRRWGWPSEEGEDGATCEVFTSLSEPTFKAMFDAVPCGKCFCIMRNGITFYSAGKKADMRVDQRAGEKRSGEGEESPSKKSRPGDEEGDDAESDGDDAESAGEEDGDAESAGDDVDGDDAESAGDDADGDDADGDDEDGDDAEDGEGGGEGGSDAESADGDAESAGCDAESDSEAESASGEDADEESADPGDESGEEAESEQSIDESDGTECSDNEFRQAAEADESYAAGEAGGSDKAGVQNTDVSTKRRVISEATTVLHATEAVRSGNSLTVYGKNKLKFNGGRPEMLVWDIQDPEMLKKNKCKWKWTKNVPKELLTRGPWSSANAAVKEYFRVCFGDEKKERNPFLFLQIGPEEGSPDLFEVRKSGGVAQYMS